MSSVVSSVAPDLNLGLIESTIIVDAIYNLFTSFLFHFNVKLSNKFHTRENLFITTIIHHHSVPGDVTHVTKQIFWF